MVKISLNKVKGDIEICRSEITEKPKNFYL